MVAEAAWASVGPAGPKWCGASLGQKLLDRLDQLFSVNGLGDETLGWRHCVPTVEELLVGVRVAIGTGDGRDDDDRETSRPRRVAFPYSIER